MILLLALLVCLVTFVVWRLYAHSAGAKQHAEWMAEQKNRGLRRYESFLDRFDPSKR